jgi:hypothetical protein
LAIEQSHAMSETSGEGSGDTDPGLPDDVLESSVRIHFLQCEGPSQSPCHILQVTVDGRGLRVVVGDHFAWQLFRCHQPDRQSRTNCFR